MTIQPISIYNEFQEIYKNKLLEDLTELTIEENPQSGFFIRYTLDYEGEIKQGKLQSFYSSGTDNPNDLKKFFLNLGKDEHFYFCDTVFKENDHFHENYDLLIYYPDCQESDAVEFLIRDYANNPTDEATKNRLKKYIQKEIDADSLVLVEEEGGIEVYHSEKEDFLERLHSIVLE
ncbi:MAG: hypothetical protein L6Q54_00895 [Leptospiraceae bacterium]|nr:hypothetical protein [Leptospiraceae bacterium]MCK6379795.1 hypothetical protein [Leptospiraceae bacterium]NUM41426.1 hypothetical protein [Leptospiraceae bacterium]